MIVELQIPWNTECIFVSIRKTWKIWISIRLKLHSEKIDRIDSICDKKLIDTRYSILDTEDLKENDSWYLVEIEYM